MDYSRDFEDILTLLEKHKAQYLIVGGLAVTFHARPRYTKDIDLWVNPSRENREKVNRALTEFGSPFFVEEGDEEHILQIGLAPNRIDILLRVEGVRFETAWSKKIRGKYGDIMTNWIDLDTLIRAKSRIDDPRHREDVRILREVKRKRKK